MNPETDRELDRVWQSLRAAEPRLDDVARARMLAGIRDRLAEETEEPLAPPRSRAAWLLGAAALVATAAAVLLIWKVVLGDGMRRLAVEDTAAGDARALIGPYLYEGGTGYPLDQPVEALSLSAGTVVRARLGAEGRITVLGPAALTVAAHEQGPDEEGPGSAGLGQPSTHTRLRLERGVLVVDYDRRSGRTLTVETPDALVVVTGTLFAVEALPGAPTRVSVYRGSVEVGPPGQARIAVSAGQSWRADQAAAGPVAGDAQELMAEHDHTVLPPEGAAGTLRIEGAPRGAVAWLGERRLGRTPLIARLPAGRVTLHVSAPDHRDVEIAAEVRPGEVSRVAHGLALHASAADAPAALRERVTGAGASAGRGLATTPAPHTAEDLYRAAESAIGRGERAHAQGLLHALVARHPGDELVDVALYELGRLAFDDGDLAAARRHLDQVLARRGDPVFLEPAAYLRCRVDVAARAEDVALACLARFRQDHPRSPHDAAALALLAALQHGRGRCDLAVPLLAEYLRRYPDGAFATEARTRLERCR
jgi:TolA-binding protein